MRTQLKQLECREHEPVLLPSRGMSQQATNNLLQQHNSTIGMVVFQSSLQQSLWEESQAYSSHCVKCTNGIL